MLAQVELRGFELPAAQTAGAWLRRFTIGHVRQLGKAMAMAQRNAYVASGVEEVTLDFDSTYVFSRSRRRQGVHRTYKPLMLWRAPRWMKDDNGAGSG